MSMPARRQQGRQCRDREMKLLSQNNALVVMRRMAPLFAVIVTAGALGACSIWAEPQATPLPPTSAAAREAEARAQTQAPEPAPEDVAAEGVTFEPSPRAPAPPSEPRDPNGVTVSGSVERQIAPPDGDPRSVSERTADIRAWDQCVTRAQNAAMGDPNRPDLTTPEELCRGRLGMSSRSAVPDSRR